MNKAVSSRKSATDGARRALLFRMLMPDHVCPFGLKARYLLKHRGYDVEDHWLTTRAEQDAFKAEHAVKTTPQTFIGGKRVGGYDDLRRFFGMGVHDPAATSYRPVIAVFVVAASLAVAIDWRMAASPINVGVVSRFIAISMSLLAMLKLQDVERFSSMFLGYDLLARRYVPYSYIYPFLELGAGILMLAGALIWLAVPAALLIGSAGAVSIFKAVYIDKRTLKCACVGGGSNVPLGFVSLTENLMMVVMAIWMGVTTLMPSLAGM